MRTKYNVEKGILKDLGEIWFGGRRKAELSSF